MSIETTIGTLALAAWVFGRRFDTPLQKLLMIYASEALRDITADGIAQFCCCNAEEAFDAAESLVELGLLDRIGEPPDGCYAFSGSVIKSLEAQKVRSVSPAPPKPLCTIYFAMGLDRVKIGITVDVDRRLRLLQAASGLDLTLVAKFVGTRQDEEELHQRFSVHRLNGEWFRWCPEIEEFIRHAVA